MKTSRELGAILQEARKKQGLDVAALAKRTGLPEKYLIALEAGQPERLPGEAYARIYYLNFARALNLDGDALLDEWPGAEPLKVAEPPEIKKNPWLWRITGLAALVVVLSFVFIRWSQRSESTSTPDRPASESVQSPDISPLVALPLETTDSAIAPSDSDSAFVATTETVAAPPAAPAGPREHQLSVTASGESWVEVIVDGDTLRSHLMQAAMTDTILTHGQIMISVGRPESVTVTLDGKVVDFPATHGQPVRRFRIETLVEESTP